MLQAGILGAGSMGRMHALAVNASGLGKVAKVYSPEPDGAVLASDIGAQCVSSVEAICEDKSIDVVVIASPPSAHAEHLKLARAAGKHILCEKPAVRTAEQADEIEALFKDYDKTVGVGHVLHFVPEYVHLKNVIDSGALGQVGVVRLGRCGWSPALGRPWFGDFKISGGVILDLMLHDIDLLTWIFGGIERLYAVRSGSTVQIKEDYALCVAKLRSGAIAHLEASWMEPSGTFYYYYEVAGSNGLIDFDTRSEPSFVFKPKAQAGQAGAVPVMQTPSVASPYDLQMRSFLARAQEGKQAEVTLQDGLRVLRLMLAAVDSSLSDKVATF